MSQFVRELLAFEPSGVDIRAGALGLVVLALFAAAVAVVGPVAIAAAIGALVCLSTDPPPPGRAWAAALLPLILGGAVLTFLAVWVDGNAIVAAVLAGLVTLVGTLQAGRSAKAGARGLIATLWIIIALTLFDSGVAPIEYAIAFAVGGAGGALASLARSRSGPPEGTGDDDAEGGPGVPSQLSLGSLLRSPLGILAVLRAIGIAAGIWIGFTYFPVHAAWVAVTSLIVIRPPTHKAVVVGVQRSLGTGVGVIIAVTLAGVAGQTTLALIVLFLVTAFLMMSVREVNYALFAMLAAAMVVFLQRIVQGDVVETALDRFVATVIGVVIAFVVLGSVALLGRARMSAA